MKINSIINRYIFRELFAPFCISVVFITFIFLMTTILSITNMIVNYRVGLGKVLLILIYSMPFFLEFIIPMAVMMAVLLTFLRMSGDNEIMALKNGGTSIYGLLPPVACFCLMGFLLTAFMAIYGLPWGRTAFKSLAIEVVQSHLDVGLKERTFNDSFENVMLYVNKVDLKQNRLIDVFIEDQRQDNIVSTVIAPLGQLLKETDKAIYHLRLYKGMVNQVNLKQRTAHTVHFDTYDVRLDARKVLAGIRGGGPKDEEEMSLAELRAYVAGAEKKDDRYYLVLMEFHKKFSLPAACFALGLLALPLGIQSHAAKRSFGIGLGLIFFLLYYMLLSAGWVFGEAGVYPPLIGMWVPNLVMGGIGAVLLVLTARERSLNLTRRFTYLKQVLFRQKTEAC